MPVSALSPYVPDAIFSEDHCEELRLILYGIELQLRMSMNARQKRLLKKHGMSKIVKLTDWSSVADVTDVTLSRYNNGHSRPPLALIQFLRQIFEQVEERPEEGVDALVDYLNRRPGPSIEDIKFPSDVVKVPQASGGYSSISSAMEITRDPDGERSNTESSSAEGSSGEDPGERAKETAGPEEEPA